MNKTKEEIEAQIIARLKLRTELQRIVRSTTSAISEVEKELADLVQQLQQVREFDPADDCKEEIIEKEREHRPRTQRNRPEPNVFVIDTQRNPSKAMGNT